MFYNLCPFLSHCNKILQNYKGLSFIVCHADPSIYLLSLATCVSYLLVLISECETAYFDITHSRHYVANHFLLASVHYNSKHFRLGEPIKSPNAVLWLGEGGDEV